MNTLKVTQVVVFGLLAVACPVANVATILVLVRRRQCKNAIRTLDPTTKALMINISVCDLVLCVSLPLHIWNIVVGAHWPFDGSVMCQVFFNTTLTTRVTDSLHVALAVTRLIAVLWPHKFHAYMQSIFAKIILNVVSKKVFCDVDVNLTHRLTTVRAKIRAPKN